VEPESVDGWFRYEVDAEAALSDERFKQVSHHVHLRVLAALRLAPQHWVVEQVERRRLELADQLQRVAGVHRHHVTSGRHRYRLHACSVITTV